METPRHPCLLVALFLPVLTAMPEPVSEESWEPPEGSPPMPLSIPPMNGPGRPFYHNQDNSTVPPAGSLEAYCQMLLQVPVPSEQIPWFCLCPHCQNNQGPKGERGDRGLPGKQRRPAPTLTGYVSKDERQRYPSSPRSSWKSWKTRHDRLQGSSRFCGQSWGQR